MRYYTWVMLIPLLFLVSCGSGAEVASPPTASPTLASPPTEVPAQTPTPAPTTPAELPTATTVSTPTAVPTVTPPPAEEAPTDTPMAPTDTPLPAATATPSPAPPPKAQIGGMAGFRDNLATADQFVLNLTGVSTPADGQVYQGWLVSDDGVVISVGPIPVNADGSVAFTWNSPNSDNLLARYARFQMTLEPAAGSADPTGPVVLAGGLAGDQLTNARHVFVKNDGVPATPLNTSFGGGLLAQTDVAVQHVQNAVNAAAIGAMPETRMHLEHVINILEGAASPRFGDHDGNGQAQDPGDGFGTVVYAEQIAELFKGRPGIDQAMTQFKTQATAIEDKCLAILQIQDMTAVSAQLGELKAMADQLKAGPMTDLYQAAQEAVSFEVKPVE